MRTPCSEGCSPWYKAQQVANVSGVPQEQARGPCLINGLDTSCGAHLEATPTWRGAAGCVWEAGGHWSGWLRWAKADRKTGAAQQKPTQVLAVGRSNPMPWPADCSAALGIPAGGDEGWKPFPAWTALPQMSGCYECAFIKQQVA